MVLTPNPTLLQGQTKKASGLYDEIKYADKLGRPLMLIEIFPPKRHTLFLALGPLSNIYYL